jgi:hypothetical protein
VYLIIHQLHHRPYISGVFRDQTTANAYVAVLNIKKGVVVQEFESLSSLSYPLYLFEATGAAFVLDSAAEITAMLMQLPRQTNDEWCYGNVYQINHDWQPPRAGSDAMGMLPHVHIDNHNLNIIQNSGVAACFQ